MTAMPEPLGDFLDRLTTRRDTATHAPEDTPEDPPAIMGLLDWEDGQ